MQFVTRRPRFPLGYQAAELPPVQKTLYSDGIREIYLLERSAESECLLIADKSAETSTLLEAIDLFPHGCAELLDHDRTAGTFALRVNGVWWAQQATKELDGFEWKSFLIESGKILKSAHRRGLRPALHPALLWLAKKVPALLPLFATREHITEQEILGDFARVLLSASTGIDENSLKEISGEQLRSWNRNVPADVLKPLIACLPNTGHAGISGFDELEARIEGKPESITVGRKPNGSGFNEIAGMRELKEWLGKEILGPLREPERYAKYRISIPNGILFYGPPGCGKTYVARQLAQELGYFFKEVKPSDVASPYIHSTVLRIRDMFDEALEKAPSVLFIDEFDAFAPSRSDLGGHQQYKSEEVNEFLASLEGAAERKVLVIGATNSPEKIDPAIRRTGRFDKLVLIPPPDADARTAMLTYHLRGRLAESDIDVAGVAMVLDGYAASDIKMLVDEAARLALAANEPISTENLLSAMQRVPASITEKDLAHYNAFQSRGF